LSRRQKEDYQNFARLALSIIQEKKDSPVFSHSEIDRLVKDSSQTTSAKAVLDLIDQEREEQMEREQVRKMLLEMLESPDAELQSALRQAWSTAARDSLGTSAASIPAVNPHIRNLEQRVSQIEGQVATRRHPDSGNSSRPSGEQAPSAGVLVTVIVVLSVVVTLLTNIAYEFVAERDLPRAPASTVVTNSPESNMAPATSEAGLRSGSHSLSGTAPVTATATRRP
jgi:hypothetical protein